MNSATTTSLTIETLSNGDVRTSPTAMRAHARYRGVRVGGVVSYQVAYDLAGLVWNTLGARNIEARDFASTRARIDAALRG